MEILIQRKEELMKQKQGDFISFYPIEDLESVPDEISIDTFEEYAAYRAECRYWIYWELKA